MWKVSLAGAVALAVTGTVCAQAQDTRAFAPVQTVATTAMPVLTGAEISRVKAALRLTADQAIHWPVIEATLRDVAAQQSRGPQSSSARGKSALTVVLTSSAVSRLTAAAMPLFRTLDSAQRGVAMQLVQARGLGRYATAL